MTTQKLEKKIAQYHDNEWVKLNKNPFKKLLTRLPTDREQGISQSEKIISAKLFYLIVKSGKTSAATAIFNTKHQVDALEQVSWADLDWYLEHPQRSSLSSMYNNRGFPIKTEVELLENFLVNWTDSAETRAKLFSSITGMQNKKGAPKEDTLNKLLDWCKENTPEGESYTTLLSSITGMQCGKGAPEEKTLNKLLD